MTAFGTIIKNGTAGNGVPTFEDGTCTGATPGKLLRYGWADHAMLSSKKRAPPWVL